MIARLASALLGVALVLSGPLTAPAVGPDLGTFGLQAYESPPPAPAFTLPDVGGRTWSLAELRGKVVLLFFWATW